MPLNLDLNEYRVSEEQNKKTGLGLDMSQFYAQPKAIPSQQEEQKLSGLQWWEKNISDPVLGAVEKMDKPILEKAQAFTAKERQIFRLVPKAKDLQEAVATKNYGKISRWYQDGKMLTEDQIRSQLDPLEAESLINELNRKSKGKLFSDQGTAYSRGLLVPAEGKSFIGKLGAGFYNLLQSATSPEQFTPSNVAINLFTIGIGSKLAAPLVETTLKRQLTNVVKTGKMTPEQAKDVLKEFKLLYSSPPDEVIRALRRLDIPVPYSRIPKSGIISKTPFMEQEVKSQFPKTEQNLEEAIPRTPKELVYKQPIHQTAQKATEKPIETPPTGRETYNDIQAKWQKQTDRMFDLGYTADQIMKMTLDEQDHILRNDKKAGIGTPQEQGAVPKEPYEMSKQEFENYDQDPYALGVDENAVAKQNQWLEEKKRLVGKRSGQEILKTSEKYGGNVEHRFIIENALKEGKQVPDNVLADYPDLAKTAQKEPTKPADMTNAELQEIVNQSKDQYVRRNFPPDIRKVYDNPISKGKMNISSYPNDDIFNYLMDVRDMVRKHAPDDVANNNLATEMIEVDFKNGDFGKASKKAENLKGVVHNKIGRLNPTQEAETHRYARMEAEKRGIPIPPERYTELGLKVPEKPTAPEPKKRIITKIERVQEKTSAPWKVSYLNEKGEIRAYSETSKQKAQAWIDQKTAEGKYEVSPDFADLSKATPEPKAETPIPEAPKVSPEEVSNVTIQEQGFPTTRMNPNDIDVRPSEMQFKRIDDMATGTNKEEALSGQWDELKGGHILVWQPKGGGKPIVVNGHHRLELARENNVKSIEVKILKEDDPSAPNGIGWSKKDAFAKGAEINIAEGRGSIYDRVEVLRNDRTTLSKDEQIAKRNGVSKSAGKAYTISYDSEDNTFDAFTSRAINADQAEIIAKNAPNDYDIQAIGIRLAKTGKTGADLENTMQALKMIESDTKLVGKQLDMFGGADNELFKRADDIAGIVKGIKKDISDRILSVKGILKRPKQAGEMGAQLKDAYATEQEVKRLEAELSRWDKWYEESPDSEIRQRIDKELKDKNLADTSQFTMGLGAKGEGKVEPPEDLIKGNKSDEIQIPPPDPDEGTIYFGAGIGNVSHSKGQSGLLRAFREIGTAFNPTKYAPQKGLDILRTDIGKYENDIFRVQRTTDKIRKKWDTIPELERYTWMDDMEKGKEKSPLGQLYRYRLDNIYNAITQYKKINYIENFFPHFWDMLWKGKAPDLGVIMNAKRPMGGPREFLKHRTFEFIQDGVKAGGKLITSNPEELVQLKERSAGKFVLANEILEDSKRIGLAKFGHKFDVPDDYATINQNIAKVYFPKDVAQVVIGGKPTNRFVEAGEWYFQKDLARLIENYFSKDLIYDTQIGKAIMDVKNTLNVFQLGLSAFHGTMVTLDAMTQQLSTGFTKIVPKFMGGGGRPLSGLAEIMKTPFAPFKYAYQGHQFFKGNPKYSKFDPAVFGGGARLQSRQYWKNTQWDMFLKNFREKKYGTAAIRAPIGIVEASMRPLMNFYIPRMKVGAFLHLYGTELERLAPKIASGEISVEQIRASVWNNIENRLGEINYDNMFLNRNIKTGLMLGFRSVGWNLGTLRELGGGIFIDPLKYAKATVTGTKPNFTPKMAYTTALFTFLAGAGAVYQYLHTRKMPKKLIDFYYPKNGEKDANGNDYRVEFPTYLKDIYQVSHHPIRTVANKLAPQFTGVLDLLQNKDFFGDYIRNENDNLPEQAKQVRDYLLKQFEPFSVQQIRQQRKGKAKLLQEVEAVFGMIKAPSDIIKSDEQKEIERLYKEQAGERGPRTPEQKKIDELKAKARFEIKEKGVDGSETYWQLVKMGVFPSARSREMFIKSAKLSSYERMKKSLSKKRKLELLKNKETEPAKPAEQSGYKPEQSESIYQPEQSESIYQPSR